MKRNPIIPIITLAALVLGTATIDNGNGNALQENTKGTAAIANKESHGTPPPQEKQQGETESTKTARPTATPPCPMPRARAHTGRIGTFGGQKLDSPGDNVFHIYLEDIPATATAYLTYELYGAKDSRSVSRGINDAHATGGACFEPDTVWKSQKERIPVQQLKQGDNVVRFTALQSHGYAVRNVGISIGTEKRGNKEARITLNSLDNRFSGNTAYIEGQLTGNIPEGDITIKANGQPLYYGQGAFFGTVTRGQEIKNDGWDIEITATDNNGWETSQKQHYKKAQHAVYAEGLTGDIATAEIEATKGDTLTLEVGGATLHIDSLSLTKKTTLTISTLRQIDLMPTQSGLTNVTGKHPGYRMLPHGQRFKSPVRIGLPYDSTQIPKGYTAKDIRTYYFDENKGAWTALAFDTVDTENHIAYAFSTHFTDFINGVIQVPESPETQGYTPTSIKDLEVADPAYGIVQIAPPTANNSGSANLSFPFKLPAGRHGMSPSLSINYSSGGGNGWIGEGWSLPAPAISVETRWGVPRYDAGLETETYLMSGGQLSPVAHRSEWEDRTSNKQFYPRIEGSFARIIRKGDSPDSYWWEVTTTDGTKYYYGSTDGKDVSEDHVLASGDGNIAEWKLAKVVDLNSNTMSYTYQSPAYGSEPLSAGKSLYLSNINYTGYDGADGNYDIDFILQGDEKADARIAANYGFLVSDGYLLDRVEITYNGGAVRSYQLEYTEGAYDRPLLQSVTELDADGEEFYTNSFEYYNEIENEGSYAPFKDAETLSLEKDGLNGGDVLSLAQSSAIGSSKSTSVGGGMYMGIGTGIRVWTKVNTIGGSYHYHKTYGKGINTLIDLDGDRLPDKVFTDGDNLYYRPWLKGQGSFGGAVELDAPAYFQKTESTSSTAGIALITSVGSIGATKRTTRTVTENYFSDVNGDGLTDLVKEGEVYYNYLDASGNPTFTRTLGDLAVPTYEDGEISEELATPDYEDWEEEVEENPLNDIVRVWEAPYDGTVNITGDVSLVQADEAYSTENADGIIARVQHNGDVLWTDSITAPFSGSIAPNLTISVDKGDRLYFRLQSNFNAMYDAAEWSPTVTYTDKSTLLDVNGLDYYSYNATDAFLPSSPSGDMFPADGTVSVRTYFSKPRTTDDVTIEYVLTDTLENDTVVYAKTLAWDEEFSDSLIAENIAVDGADHSLLVRISSKTNVDWAALETRTRYEYTACTDADFTLGALQEEKYYTVPHYTAYTLAKGLSAGQTFTAGKVLLVNAVLKDGAGSGIAGKLNLSVKRENAAPCTKDIQVTNTTFEDDSTLHGMVTQSGEKLYFAVHTDSSGVYGALEAGVNVSWVDTTVTGTMYTINGTDTLTATGDFRLDTLRPYTMSGDTLVYFTGTGKELKISSTQLDTTSTTAQAGIYCSEDYTLFGPMYRHWGQFSYNSENGTIDEDDLDMDEYEGDTDIEIVGDTYEEQESSYTSDGGTNPMDEPFIQLYASGETGRWTGYDDSVYVAKSTASSSRRGEKDLIPYADLKALALSEATGKRAINKKSKDVSKTVSLGAIYKKAGLSTSTTTGDAEVQTGFMDMNGDGFPDIINGSAVQYSTPLGSLSEETGDIGGNVSESSSTAKGASLNGTIPAGEKSTADKNCVSVGVGVGGTSLEDGDDHTFLDINGDGLPDKVYKGGDVQLNLGYGLSDTIQWTYTGSVRKTESVDVSSPNGILGFEIDAGTGELTGTSLPIYVGAGSFVAGTGASANKNHPNVQFMDINGDGLPDKVATTTGDSPTTSAYLNTGVGFTDKITFGGLNAAYNKYSINAQLDVAYTFGFYIPFVNIRVVFNPSVDGSRGFNRTTESLMDFDGDGRPDYLESTKEDKLTLHCSNYGKTNKLHSVNNALGSTITLSYEKRGNTFEMPQQTWVLSEVETFDGHTGDGADYTKTSYSYGQGHYDRYERTFYGFDTVIAKQLDTENNDQVYRTIVKTFENTNYHSQGLMLKSTLYDSSGNRYTETQNTYMFKNLSDNSGATSAGLPEFSDGTSWFPYLAETEQLFYEGQETAGKTARNAFGYDSYGNVTKYTGYGDESTGDDVIEGNVTYHSDGDSYIYAVPESIEVTSGGEVYRKRETDMDGKGQITEVRSYITTGTYATANLEYDKYGNIEKSTSPENANGERMYFEYTYDEENHAYVTGVEDAFGYSSGSEYDYRFGAVLSTTDRNGQPMDFAYDSKGRLAQVAGPKEIEDGVEFTIRHSYYPFADVPYALTEHYDPANPSDFIETATFVDGLGRGIQVKKDAAIYQDSLSPANDMMAVSGHVAYDAFGRAVKAYQPITEEKGQTATFNTEVDNITPTVTAYDIMDRAVKTTLPDGNESTTAYGFGSDRDGTAQFMVTATDPLGNQTVQYADARGRQTAVKMQGDIWLSRGLDPIGQLLQTTDADNNVTSSVYDLLGRRLERDHPDAGKTVWAFDNLGNMVSMQNAHCDQPTTYAYEYGRLTDITYPDNEYNNVHYEYGEAGAEENRAGRIESVEDGTGAQVFYYGSMGEVTKTVRSVVVPDNGTYAFKTEWEYDTWGRVLQMAYPDGEIVSYAYNSGGTLESMTGEKGLSVYEYVKSILYDKFGQRKFIAYGNGTQTSYTYDPYRRWLSHLSTTTASGRAVQDNQYTYDAVGNILQLANGAEASTADGSYGGSVTHTYGYDGRYQPTSASGTYTTSGKEYRYTLDMEYGNTGQILRKNQSSQWKADGSDDWADDTETTYDYTYSYNGQKPHIVTSIHNATAEEDYVYQYDASGNNLSSDEPGLETERYILWTEDNRIKAIKSQGNVGHYVYDASGERVLKLHSNSMSISINGASAGVSEVNDNFTVYPNAYFVVNTGQYTKHFYIGGQRVLSKIGSDDVGDVFYEGGSSSDGVDYESKQEALESEVGSNMNSFGLTWYRDANGEVPSKYIKLYLLAKENGNKVGSGSDSDDSYSGDVSDSLLEQDSEYEVDQYYVHPDHLGSASFITDLNGETYQHVEYLPFGEVFAEERNTEQDRFTYLYNGKELDEMTGLYYYGARYMSPRESFFLGVDPMMDKHGDFSPFAYCYNNPINYIDPMGLDTVYVLDQAERPTESSAYTATIYYIAKGEIVGPYEGSSFPDNAQASTTNEGEYSYNNVNGHSGGSRKGLNLVDENGDRNTPGTDTEGNEVNMQYVNIHDSWGARRRYSDGCTTIPHGDPEGFFDNFYWGGTYNGNSGTTGCSTGKCIIQRGADADATRTRLEGQQDYQQNPLQRAEPIRVTIVSSENQ